MEEERYSRIVVAVVVLQGKKERWMLEKFVSWIVHNMSVLGMLQNFIEKDTIIKLVNGHFHVAFLMLQASVYVGEARL